MGLALIWVETACSVRGPHHGRAQDQDQSGNRNVWIGVQLDCCQMAHVDMMQETFDAAVQENQDEFGMEVRFAACLDATSRKYSSTTANHALLLCSQRKPHRVQWKSSSFR